jgi:hypothetical protein
MIMEIFTRHGGMYDYLVSKPERRNVFYGSRNNRT